MAILQEVGVKFLVTLGNKNKVGSSIKIVGREKKFKKILKKSTRGKGKRVSKKARE